MEFVVPEEGRGSLCRAAHRAVMPQLQFRWRLDDCARGLRNLSGPPVSKRAEHLEDWRQTMARPTRMPLFTLGWQTWSFVVIVLAISLAAAAFVMLG